MPASRRQFLQNTALASVALSLAPAALVRAAGEQASGAKLNIAGIGVGGTRVCAPDLLARPIEALMVAQPKNPTKGESK